MISTQSHRAPSQMRIRCPFTDSTLYQQYEDEFCVARYGVCMFHTSSVLCFIGVSFPCLTQRSSARCHRIRPPRPCLHWLGRPPLRGMSVPRSLQERRTRRYASTVPTANTITDGDRAVRR